MGEIRLKQAGSYVRIVNNFKIKLKLLQHPAHPAFIHAGCPGLVDSQAIGGQRLNPGRLNRINTLYLKPEPFSQSCYSGRLNFAPVNDQAAGRISLASDRNRSVNVTS